MLGLGLHISKDNVLAAGGGFVDPLAGIDFFLRLQADRGDGVPTGLYQDDAFTIPALTVSDPIGGWRNDLGGGGASAVQSNVMKKASLQQDGNGKHVVRFDGVDDVLMGTLASSGTALIIRHKATAGQSGAVFSDQSINAFSGTHQPFANGLTYENFGSPTRVDGITTGAMDSWSVYIVSHSGGTMSIRLNGSPVASTAATFVDKLPFAIGQNHTLALDQFFYDGDVSHIFVLDAVDALTVEAYLLGLNSLFRYVPGNSIASRGTFSRASTAPYTDENGDPQEAAVDVLRDSHYIDDVRTTLLTEADSGDPLADIPFSLRLQTHIGDNIPLGLYQDPSCTIPATVHGEPIAAFRDELSGTPTILTQTIPGSIPTLNIGVDGNPSVAFDGSNDFLRNLLFIMDLSERSVFIALQQTSDSNNAGILVITPASGDDYRRTDAVPYEVQDGDNYFTAFAGLDTTLYEVKIPGVGLAPSAVYSEIFGAGEGSIYLDGVLIDSDSSAPAFTNSGGGLLLGARLLSGVISAPYFGGLISAILIMPRRATSDEADRINDYLTNIKP